MPYQSWEEVQGMLRIDAVMLAAEQPRNCLPVAAVGRTALLRLVLHVALPLQIHLQGCERHQHSRMCCGVSREPRAGCKTGSATSSKTTKHREWLGRSIPKHHRACAFSSARTALVREHAWMSDRYMS